MRPHTARTFSAFLAVSLAVSSGSAAAEPPPQGSAFSPQLFHPNVGPDEFFTVSPATPLAHLNYSLGLWLNYSRQTFSIFNVSPSGIADTRANVLANTLALDAVFAIGLFNRLQIGLGIPMALFQNGDAGTMLNYNGEPFTLKTPGVFALGDPWIDIKLRILGKDKGIQLGIAAFVTVPLSAVTPNNSIDDSGNFYGEGGENLAGEKVAGVTAGGKLLAGWESERWRAGLSFGGFWRQNQSKYFSSVIGSQLVYGAAFAYDVIGSRKLAVVAELHGRADLSNVDANGNFTINNINGVPLELDVGAKVRIGRNVFFNLGVGTGIVRGLGAPLVRVFTGLTFAPDRRDRDKDGVADTEDKCLDIPEDKDGWKDDDGCPESDNDGDNIPDERDRCPNEAEDADGFEDDDGCPELDNDKDGIVDMRDACPADAEDKKPPKVDDGCPIDKVDTDGDEIPDGKDKCPTDPEDHDQFEDTDGCPDPDNDKDEILDTLDKCPNEAEDKDGFADDDGCPDPDNDMDGVLDGKDKCPNEPETLNGVNDEDGCPDKGPQLKVQIVGDEIIILEKVFFKTGKSVIEKKSFNLLDQVSSVLKMHPEITGVLIEGHTDGKGNKAKNMKLSQDRAEAVKTYLTKKRVAATRLKAQGFGPTRPVADNKSERGREANRRVQFKILEQQKP